MSQSDDKRTMNFLVYLSPNDSIPQRVQLTVQHPLSAENMLNQIRVQLVQPKAVPYLVPPRISVDATLSFFNVKERCYVTVDGMPLELLQDYGQLLVHSPGFVCPPLPTPIPPCDEQPQVNTSESSSSFPVERPTVVCRNNDCKNVCIGGPANGTECEQGCGAAPSVGGPNSTAGRCGDGSSAGVGNGVSQTMRLMLQVTGIILCKYASSLEDVIEPTKEGVWGLIEEVLYKNGDVAPYSLDPHTVDAFVEMITRSLSLGKEQRLSSAQRIQ
ncbi:hypothetical protein ERJ75_001004300 [Trypanosoma vivax]|uniref:Uncharacterized protein n=1 Tax=Trypanosoma vivax (strain Y486) TaxID=1055687 RepID=G0TYG2_TRYVY|nr:hypothetical protein TRVL_08682 [Trypanosoma vivax]KAH8611241.1 hypothetical protein ERJ75_001004300 [Trypanosoma vivax]CCC49009.1 conserved hypothetical protein [Trypanosoma vivax Y486]